MKVRDAVSILLEKDQDAELYSQFVDQLYPAVLLFDKVTKIVEIEVEDVDTGIKEVSIGILNTTAEERQRHMN
jgi:hypothetical protein